MKPIKKISAGIILTTLVVAMNAQVDDDVYYTPSRKKVENKGNTQATQSPADNSSKIQPVADEYYTPAATNTGNNTSTIGTPTDSAENGGNTYITNNYYDDYNYSYASRIRRFHNPIYSYSYYDPFYTNTYMYSYNPYQYGMSIYMGYSWWGPSYYSYSYCPSSYWGFGFGYGGFGMRYGYGGYYNPYYSGWGYGYGYPMFGYRNGYMNGFYNGLAYGNNYYNSYDPNSYYGSRGTYHYGPRGGGGTNSTNGRQQLMPPTRTLADTYTSAVPNRASGNVSEPPVRHYGAEQNFSGQSPQPARISGTTIGSDPSQPNPVRNNLNAGSSPHNDRNNTTGGTPTPAPTPKPVDASRNVENVSAPKNTGTTTGYTNPSKSGNENPNQRNSYNTPNKSSTPQLPSNSDGNRRSGNFWGGNNNGGGNNSGGHNGGSWNNGGNNRSSGGGGMPSGGSPGGGSRSSGGGTNGGHRR